MAIDTIARALSGQANATAADAKTTAEQAMSTAMVAVPGAVTAWLDENVDPVGSAVVVDSSLSISGAAADAKATGDGLTDLKNSLNTLLDNITVAFIQGTINSQYGTVDTTNANRIVVDSYIDITNGTIFSIPAEYDYNVFFYKRVYIRGRK